MPQLLAMLCADRGISCLYIDRHVNKMDCSSSFLGGGGGGGGDTIRLRSSCVADVTTLIPAPKKTASFKEALRGKLRQEVRNLNFSRSFSLELLLL
jgi:hypothetical protein